MAVYSRTGGNLPSTGGGSVATQTPLASKDLGTVIIKSLQTVADSLSGNDVPVSYKDVEKAVTQGVNKSDLVKKGMKNGVATGSKAELALAAKYEQDKFIKWQEYQRKLQKWDEEDRKKKESEEKESLNRMRQKVEETWSGIATAVENPLKGISNVLDKTVKDFSTGFLKGFKDARGGNTNTMPAVASVGTSPEISNISTQITDLSDLIKDNFDQITDNQQEMIDPLEDLIKDENENQKDDKQKEDEQKAKENEDKKAKTAQLNATQKIGYFAGAAFAKVGLITLGVLAVGTALSQLAMFIKGKLYTWLAEMPVKSDIRMAKIKAALAIIPDKIKLVAAELLSKVTIMGKHIFGASLSEDEEDELKALEKKSGGLLKAQGKLSQSAMNWLGADAANYDINDPEQREALKQAMLAKTRSQIAQGISPAMTENDIEKTFSNYDKSIKKAGGSMTSEELARLQELQAMKNQDFDQMKADLDAKKEGLVNQYVEEAVQKRMDEGTLTEFQAEIYKKEGYGTAITNARQVYSNNNGHEYQYAQATEKEAWIKEKYEPWVEAWKKTATDFKLNANIETSKPPRRDPTNVNGNQY